MPRRALEHGIGSYRNGCRCRVCRDANNEIQSRWRVNNRRTIKGYELESLYGITLSEYDDRLRLQEYKCKICLNGFDILTGKLGPHVDHNHVSDKVRGLLCTYCNRALGLMREDVFILNNAATHLESPPPVLLIPLHHRRSKKCGCPTCTMSKRDCNIDNMLRKYRLTLDLFNQILDEQEHRCKVCNYTFTPVGVNKNRGGNVDHNHATNTFRGILCHLCNRALGLWRDKPESIKRAIRYLQTEGDI